MTSNFINTRTHIEKIGHALIYLSTHTHQATKTKLLKLLYLLEEFSIHKYGFAFFNLRFDVWRLGPVSRDIFVELSDEPALLSDYITLTKCDEGTFISPKKDFDADEFSDLELSLLENVAVHFKDSTANDLVKYTHRKHAPWYITAQRNGLLERFALNQLNATDVEVDFSTLFENDPERPAFYKENRTLQQFAQTLQA